MKKYFTTITTEQRPGGIFNALDDEAAIEQIQAAFNTIRGYGRKIRELCIHRIDGDEIVPIFSRNFSYGRKIIIAGPDGQDRAYDLGLPITIRTSLKRQTEVSQESEWPSKQEEEEVEPDWEQLMRNLGIVPDRDTL